MTGRVWQLAVDLAPASEPDDVWDEDEPVPMTRVDVFWTVVMLFIPMGLLTLEAAAFGWLGQEAMEFVWSPVSGQIEEFMSEFDKARANASP